MPAKTKKAPAAEPKLPGALARAAAKKAADKVARLATQAHADIALIQRRRAEITESFYDIGEALVRLKTPGVAVAIGHKTFADLCRVELQMSSAKAEQLIAIATRVPREDALKLGQERTLALLAVAAATPEADSPSTLAAAKLSLPTGAKLDVKSSSTRDLRNAAKSIRATQARETPPKRGRTTTSEERALATKLEEALHTLGLPAARVTAVATKPGKPADIRIDRIPVASLALLQKAIGQARKG